MVKTEKSKQIYSKGKKGQRKHLDCFPKLNSAFPTAAPSPIYGGNLW